MKRTISILMPVRNASAYLTECLDSILAQSISNWELIAINDHSSDNSNSILLMYSLKDERIKVFNNPGKGIIDALTFAFLQSSGEFITRMDADDGMGSRKLERLSNALIKNGKGFVSTALVKYFSDSKLGNGYLQYEKWLNGLTRNNSNYNDIYKECVIPSPSWMVHRDDLIKVGGFKGSYPEDYDLCFRFRKHQLKAIGIPKILHYWRDYPTRSSRTDENYADNNFLNLKIKYFFDQDYDSSKLLALWGAGTKGKSIAKHLIGKKIEFIWLCDNPKKINTNIYGVTLCAPTDDNLEMCGQIIIGVAQKGAQEDIQNMIAKFDDLDSFWFC